MSTTKLFWTKCSEDQLVKYPTMHLEWLETTAHSHTCAVIPSCSHSLCYSIVHRWAEQKCQKTKKNKSRSMKSPPSDCNVRVKALINELRLDWGVENEGIFFSYLFHSADDSAACSQKPRWQDRAAPLLHLIGNKIPASSLSGLKHVYTSISQWLALVYQTHSFWQSEQNMVWGHAEGG